MGRTAPQFTSWFKTFLAGAGFFADAYDLFVINIAKNVLQAQYPNYDSAAAGGLALAALLGAVLGQLFFGALADKLGRRLIFVATMTLVVIGALGSASATDTGPGIFMNLTIWRGVLGFGIGGEYPLSATVSSEGATTAGRGKAVSLVFSMQGMGNLAACLLFYVLLKANLDLDVCWRIALAAGAAPGVLTLYWRYRMEESHHFEREGGLEANDGADESASGLIESESLLVPTNAASSPKVVRKNQTFAEHVATTWTYITLNAWNLAGTAGSWFIFDIVFYANGLFTGQVLSSIGYSTATTKSNDELATLALGSFFIALIALPGYYLAMLTIDWMGRKNMQIMGFAAEGVLFIILAAALAPLETDYQGLFVFIYGLTFLFSNFGANTSTFVIPAEVFPTIAKATCHGLSAASGKLGAALGAYGMAPLLAPCGSKPTAEQARPCLATVLYICAGLSLLGLVWTLIFTRESGHLHVEDVDAEFRQKLEDKARK